MVSKNMVVGKRVEILRKAVSVCLAVTEVCTSGAISKRCFKDTLAMDNVATICVGTEQKVPSKILGVVLTLLERSEWLL